MIGIIIPARNCASDAERNSSSLRLSNSFVIESMRPKTVARSWPEKASSTCPLRSPVAFHCALNCFCAREPMTAITTAVSGSASSATRASCQDTVNIMTVMPTTMSRL